MLVGEKRNINKQTKNLLVQVLVEISYKTAAMNQT